jgi:hypothetical protein
VNVVEQALTAGDVEAPVLEGERGPVGLDELGVGGSKLARRLQVLAVGVRADHLAHMWCEGKCERAGAAAGVERELGTGEREEQALDAGGEVRSTLFLKRKAK